MDDKVYLELSRTSIFRTGAIILALCGFAALLFALLPLVPSSEDGHRTRINTIADSYETFSEDPQERDKKIREVEGELLKIAQESSNPVTRASAFAGAGIVVLGGYQKALDAHKASAIPVERGKPSPTRLDSAAEYLGEAARICADRGEYAFCPWEKIQKNLDAVRLLLGEDARVETDPNEENGGEKGVPGDTPRGGNTDQSLSRQAGDGAEDDFLFGSEQERGAVAGNKEGEIKGSVRGALSEEVQDPSLEDESSFQVGGGATSRPNVP